VIFSFIYCCGRTSFAVYAIPQQDIEGRVAIGPNSVTCRVT